MVPTSVAPFKGCFAVWYGLFKPSSLLSLLPTDIYLSCCGVDSPSVRCLLSVECLLPFAAVKTSCAPPPRSNKALILQRWLVYCSIVLITSVCWFSRPYPHCPCIYACNYISSMVIIATVGSKINILWNLQSKGLFNSPVAPTVILVSTRNLIWLSCKEFANKCKSHYFCDMDEISNNIASQNCVSKSKGCCQMVIKPPTSYNG